MPYRGGPFAITALLQGDVDIFFYQTGPVIDFYRQGSARLLGVTSATRVAAVPEILTIAEACDMPGFESTTWYAMMAPARTPTAILPRLEAAFAQVAREPEIEARVIALGLAPAITTSTATCQRLAREVAIWREVGATAD